MAVERDLGRFVVLVRRNLVELALVELAFHALGLFVLGPLAAAGLALVVARSGSAVVGNQELAGFFATPTGIALALAWLTARATRDLLLMSGFVALLEAERVGERATAWAALRVVARRLGGALRIGAEVALRVALLALPFVAAVGVVARLVVAELDLQYLVAVKPPRFWAGVVAVALLAAGFVAVLAPRLASWSLAVPMLVRGAVPAREALARSAERIGGQRWRVAWRLVAWWAAVSLAGAALLGAGGWAGVRAVEAVAQRHPAATAAAVLALLALELSLGVFVQLVAWAGQAAYLVQLDLALPGGPVAREAPERVHSPVGLWVAAGLAVVAGLGAASGAAELLGPPRPVVVTAHRGASGGAPENTRAALLLAIEEGADYAEIDVQELADGELAVIHDTDLLRVAGRPERVCDLTLAEIRQVDLGAWFDPRFAGERAMTLAEAIEVAGERLKLNVELKLHGKERALAAAAVAAVRAAGFEERCVLTSLDAGVLAQVRALAPELRTGYIVSAKVGEPSKLGVDLLAVSTRLATRDQIRRTRAAGLELHVWTVDDPREMQRYVARGVDGILTDHPARLRAFLDERATWSDQERLLRALRRSWSE